jgi:hypothetical protein
VLVGQQYLADPSRSVGTTHPLYAYAHVPAGYSGDVTAAIEEQIERFAPGFRERILARHVRSTAQMEAHNANYVGGDVVTGANSARQLVFRPRVATNPYSLGVPGVYLCSGRDPAWRRRPRDVRVQRGPRGARPAAVAQPAIAAVAGYLSRWPASASYSQPLCRKARYSPRQMTTIATSASG